MGKISAAKKKAKRKDFQKVKFKVGKKLPKNLNETKATFQAKTLIIKKQFQLEKEGPVSHRNLSWKELLAHLGHHNQSIKLDAINSLKEMIIGNPDFIRLELSYLLESLCPVFSDREYKVREAAMQLFKTIILLSGLNQKKHNVLEPFYNLINVHLTFSMTHIVESIQQSSLKFLDILIEHMPELVRVHSYDIFENFINQISKAAVKGDKRTLKNEPYKMTSTQTWRSSVLSRLYKMLKIVLSSDVSKNKKFLDTEDIGDWIKTNGCQTLVATFDDIDKQCYITTYPNKTEQMSLRISKRMNGKKSLTEVKEFFETYFKIVTPLLVECWLEAKPENKQIIESNESLDIMNSVLLILNLLLDNLEFNFSDLTIQLKSSKGSNQINYIENLFLADFPYMLAENFEYSTETRKTTQQINGNTINLLLCKFCSSSLLKLTEDKLFAIFEYCLNTLMKANAKNCNENVPLETNELQTLLKLSETIFKNFSRSEIVKPFAISLISYFDSVSNFSTNKWIVFEFLCKQFYENDKLMNSEYDNIFLSFYKKLFKYCISYEKEKKERIEQLIDWLRMIIIRRAKSQKILINLLENEYINMINALDFESKEVTDSAKKKLLELLFWLPKINRYLFSKLSILILTKKISIINTNQILDILKTMLEDSSAPSRFDHSDYLMFMLCLFNGSSGFDLTNSLPAVNGESFIIDIPKFCLHKVLCKHLEEYLGSHKNSDLLIEILLSTSLPVLINLHTVPCSTLYGSLSLMSKLEQFDGSPLLYNTIIEWLFKLSFWLINKIQSNQNNQVGTIDRIDDINQCLNEIQLKVEHILKKNSQLMNDLVSKICLTGFAMSNSLELKRKSFILVNFFLARFSSSLKKSQECLLQVFYIHQKTFNNTNYPWWHEFSSLLKSI